MGRYLWCNPAMKNPVNTIIRRRNAADKARSILYGVEKARPFGRATRNKWSQLAAFYCGRGFMRYSEFLEVATTIAPVVRPMARKVSAKTDDFLYERFRTALIKKAKQIAEDEPERQDAFRKGTKKAQKLAWIKDAVLLGLCPVCGDEDPAACGHGYENIELDGNGGLVQYVE